MKRIVFLVFALAISSIAFSQAPQAFNYQALLRNSDGEPLKNEAVIVKINILQGSISGFLAYSEVHNTETNEFGLVNLVVGDGETSNDLSDINWTEGPFFVEIFVNDLHMGTNSLLSVPYALHAGTVDNTDDADADPENELQELSIEGNSLTISEGNSVIIPSTGSAWINSGDNLYFNGGNVGIGISTPLAKLTVLNENLPETSGSRVNWLRLYGNSSNSDNLYIYHRRHTEGADWNSSEVVMQKQVDSSPMHFLSFKGLTPNDAHLEMGYANTPYFTMTAAGRIGINTTTPSKILEVNGSVRFGSDMNLWNGDKSLHFRQDANNSWISNIGDFVSNGSSGNGALNLIGEAGVVLRYGQGSGAGTVGFTLTDQGNVGIGITNPGNFALNVNENKDVRFGHYINIADYDHEDEDARIISRDGNLFVWTGSLVIGNYSNGETESYGNGNLRVQNNVLIDGRIGVGKTASYNIDVAGTIRSEYPQNSSTGFLGLTNYGVKGFSDITGVYGSGGGFGVQGFSAAGTGIFGQSYTGLAGFFDGDVKVEEDLEVTGSIKLGTFGMDSMLVIKGTTSSSGFVDFTLPSGWNFDNTFVLNCLFEDNSLFNSAMEVRRGSYYSVDYTEDCDSGSLPPIPGDAGFVYEIGYLGSSTYVFRVFYRSPYCGTNMYISRKFSALLLKIK